MPNHFHLVLKPNTYDSIPRYISDVCNSHTRYFNLKNNRQGKLYQGSFKSKQVETEYSLNQLTRYVHLNPVASSKTNPAQTLKPENYEYSSYKAWSLNNYDELRKELLNSQLIDKWVSEIGGPLAYKSFVESKIDKHPEHGIEDIILESVS